MNLRSFLLFTFFLLEISLSFGQNTTMNISVNGLETQMASYPLEKIFIHTDRPYYVAGDDIWYAAYAVNGSDHAEDPISGLVYVELLSPSGQLLKTKHVQLTGKFGSGNLELDEDLPTGVYQLRAYTSYMLNYSYEYAFTKEVAIYNNEGEELGKSAGRKGKKQYPLRFFPEGGELVSGIDCKVAFEVVDTTIKSIDVVDLNGEIVATGKVLHQGIGYFNFTPRSSNDYKVVLNGTEFKLPYINPEGYGIKVNNLGKNSLYIDVASSEEYSLDGGYIIGHMRGLVFLQQGNLSGAKATVKLDKSTLPDGVAQFTLFDSEGKAVTERTVFIGHENNSISVKSSIPYEYINVRQKVDLSIDVKDAQNQLVEGDLSLSVVDAGLVFGQDKMDNIQSYLLLGSEFTKNIPNINTYFADSDKKTRYYLDLLMMTRGWTRIRWQDVSRNVFPQMDFPPESGFTVSGIVTHRGDPVKALVDISVVKDIYSGDLIMTKEDGRFFANLVGIQDSSQVYIKASLPDPNNPRKAGKTDNVVVRIIGNNRFDVVSTNVIKFDEPKGDFLSQYVDQSNKIRTLDSIYDAEWAIELEEVSIKATNLSRDKQIQRDYDLPYSNYSNRVVLDSLATGVWGRSIFDIVRDNVPGVEVLGIPGQNQRFRVRGGSSSILGSNDALVLVDGVETSFETLNAIPADRIAFVDIMKGAATSVIYGNPNGVVLIYTKQISDQELQRSYERPDYSKQIDYLGYTSNREFYSPDYSVAFAGAEKPDLRTTLFWNPSIEIKEGQGKTSFYSSDKITRYIIEVQGLSKKGVPFVGYDVLEVR